jgi:hypothetical protein
MKPHGSKFEYEQERNDDLMRAYHELIEAAPYICLNNIYREVVNMPSARFWVSEERAAIVIAAMMKGDQLQGMRPNKREMFNEIYRRAMILKKEKPTLSIFELAFQVVRQAAPKFYLTPGSAEVIIYRAKKKWYEQRKRKLRHLF